MFVLGCSNDSMSSKFNVGGVEGLVVNDTDVSDSEEESGHGTDTYQQTCVYGFAPRNDSTSTGASMCVHVVYGFAPRNDSTSTGASMLVNNVVPGKVIRRERSTVAIM
ncbi:hypothetical protein ACFX1X_026625 [Malus domestica]